MMLTLETSQVPYTQPILKAFTTKRPSPSDSPAGRKTGERLSASDSPGQILSKPDVRPSLGEREGPLRRRERSKKLRARARKTGRPHICLYAGARNPKPTALCSPTPEIPTFRTLFLGLETQGSWALRGVSTILLLIYTSTERVPLPGLF